MVRPSSRALQRHQLLRSFVRHKHGHPARTEPASAKLFADAISEEASDTRVRSSGSKASVNEYPNWTGEESVQDAVLRMLVDKYKPLRGTDISSAEDKLKATPPGVQPPGALGPPIDVPDASQALPSSTETHKPWLTTFRVPSHASIRHIRFLPSSLTSGVSPQGVPSHPDDSRSRIEQRERKKKAAHAGRLSNARESSLDYRLGRITAAPGDSRIQRPNPASVKGWTNLVEERILRARNEGYFRAVKGRGKPLVRDHEESNPFIPREEFLMNRIVQRQGAVPPWIEVQAELETAVASFREILRSTWTRRAVRMLTLERAHALLPSLTLADVTGARLRDPEWEAREAGYHEEALAEVNALVRKYNGVAPSTVRRTFLNRQTELKRIYEVSGPDILAEIKRRAQKTSSGVLSTGGVDDEMDGGFGRGRRENGASEPFWFSLKGVWNRLVAKIVGS